MTDDELGVVWTTLEPTAGQRRRVDARVFAWLDAHDTPLAAEWLQLFTATPVSAVGLVSAGALSVVVATPVLWLARALVFV